ncbi:MAG: C1 family peptidase, partial [Vicinamibacterales bacterium]
MLFTGVDVVDGAARRWRVEYSWGDDSGRKGFYVMNDNWFAEYTFEISARRAYLPEDLQAALDQPPIVLPAWDPMGALARGPARISRRPRCHPCYPKVAGVVRLGTNADCRSLQ